MEKAYDLKDLGEKLKLAGLPEVEDLAQKAYVAVKDWLKESAIVSLNPYDNLIIGFVDSLDAVVLPELDKIDGNKG